MLKEIQNGIKTAGSSIGQQFQKSEIAKSAHKVQDAVGRINDPNVSKSQNCFEVTTAVGETIWNTGKSVTKVAASFLLGPQAKDVYDYLKGVRI